MSRYQDIFTDVIVKDVLISGLAEDEIKREVLGWSGLDESSMEETVSFIEAKEMAREALNRHSSTNAISTYQQNKKAGKREVEKVNCQSCRIEIDKFSKRAVPDKRRWQESSTGQ